MITDYRWVEARMQLGRNTADLSGILDDIPTLLLGCGKNMDAEVMRGLELISDGTKLLMPYVAKNPREVAFHLQGRMNIHGGTNLVVDRLLLSLDTYAKRP